jgi:PGAP2IP, second transmembrane domain
MATEKPAANPPDSAVRNTGLFEHWAWASIGLGGLIFSLHCFLTDSGTLVAYSWTGYPITGPVPGFHGYLTLMAMALGIIISNSTVKTMVCHPIWMAFGALSSYLMYQWRGWPGYIAGLCLSVFLTSLIPVIIRIVSLHGKHSPGKVYFTAWLVVCLLDFANVWTVAYAFVPAGWLLRERTDM